jgi:hypothetical protein
LKTVTVSGPDVQNGLALADATLAPTPPASPAASAEAPATAMNLLPSRTERVRLVIQYSSLD